MTFRRYDASVLLARRCFVTMHAFEVKCRYLEAALHLHPIPVRPSHNRYETDLGGHSLTPMNKTRHGTDLPYVPTSDMSNQPKVGKLSIQMNLLCS